MKQKKILKWTNRVVTSVLFILFISVALMVFMTKVSGGEPNLFGYQLKTVLSGSMEPDIQTGSMIAVKPGGDMTRFIEGDVITFKENNDTLITHRIVEVIQSGENTLYRTKGDNNNGVDIEPVLSDNVVAHYTGFTVPYVGYITSFAQSKNGAFLLIIPGILLVAYSGWTIWRSLANLELPQTDQPETPTKKQHEESTEKA